jgi:SSS family solute:Na+ symporter
MVWFAVILYAVLAITIGWYARKRTESGTAFWTAGRSLSSWSVGLSISAGFMSVSWSCVYAVQLFYWYGLAAIWLITIPWLLALLAIYFLAHKYHALAAFSQPEMVGERFGMGVKRTVAAALAFVFLVWGGAEVYVAATLLAPALNMSVSTTIVGITIIVASYATLGGFRAVVATDKLQYGIVALYVIAMAWLAGMGIYAGNQKILPSPELITAKSAVSWVDLTGPGIITIVLSFIAYLPGWIFETDLWVRVQAARNAGAARIGMLIAGGNALIFVGILPLFIGVITLSLFPPVAGHIPEILGNQGDAIFSALVSQYAPAWLAILVAIGLVAAAMSTIDTCANVMGLSIAYDILELHKKTDALKASRIVTLIVMAAFCIFALNTASLWDIFYLSGGILTTVVALPVAAVFIPYISSDAILFSSRFGFIGTIIAYFLQDKGVLILIEPQWLSGSGLSFIVWGILAAAAGYATGVLKNKVKD